MPAHLDIVLQRNEDWARRLTITDNEGAPIDLTGMTAAMQVREKLSQTLVATADVDVEAPTLGEVEVLLEGGEGSALAAYGQPTQRAELFYDFRLIDAAGTRVPLFGGRVVITRGETRA